MNLYQVLKNEEIPLRITSHIHGRWLLWDGKQWCVYERLPYAKKTTTKYEGDSCDEAIQELIKEV